MTDAERREVLLVEAHHIVHEAAAAAMQRIGQPIPDEARPGYFTAEDAEQLMLVISQLDHPITAKWMKAAAAQARVLSYPPTEILSKVPSSEELDALSNLTLSAPEHSMLQGVVAEACHRTLFHFFCLLDSVGAPAVKPQDEWLGADLVGPRRDGPFLHDEFDEKYWTYQRLRRKPE
jgi:hypothetical protein